MNILAQDPFRLITYQTLDVDERDVLTLLYQPILGSDAFALYLTLWSLIHRDKRKAPEYSHAILYDTLRLSPAGFLTARQKLEAIGLLDTYHNESLYLYELKAPLSAEEFIKDGSLGAYLFGRMGKDVFETVSDLFRVFQSEKDGFENITSTFDKVFDALPRPIETEHTYQSHKKGKVTIEHAFDFDLFLDGLSKNFVDRRKISKAVRDKITTLSYVYNLDEFTMQKAFMDSVDKQRNIDLNALSKNARKWFEFEKETVRTEAPDPDRKEQLSHQDMLEKCKTETPRTILSILSSGKPSVAELNVVERLIENYDLPIEAINFLLVYVIGNLGEFPSYNYFDKVAVEWQRHQVKTAEDALEVVRKRAKRLAQSKRSHEKNTIPQDIESDWFDEYWKNR
jgi:replication initiation and membrane attachment protein